MTCWEYVLLIERRRPSWPIERKFRLLTYLNEREARGQRLALRVLRWSHARAY